jgi:hypothetical protein
VPGICIRVLIHKEPKTIILFASKQKKKVADEGACFPFLAMNFLSFASKKKEEKKDKKILKNKKMKQKAILISLLRIHLKIIKNCFLMALVS